MLFPIAAIATPFGKGAISIIRVSGEGCISLIQEIFEGKDLSKAKPNSIHYGYISKNNSKIDQVMIAIYKGPKSYTGEDMLEIFTHGGTLVTQQVLQTILSLPIELAQPGAFTERAYLNGKLDLLQAESVMDMIEAESSYALEIAKKGLFSEISKKMSQYRQSIMNIIAHIEVNIDYPEFESEYELTQTALIPAIKDINNQIQQLILESQKNKWIKEGIKTAIIGKPNVGKSSLLNHLIKEDKAIVTHIPGTTRDIVEGKLHLQGITLHLLDTAGIRETQDIVEHMGIEKSMKVINEADLILLILDSSEPLSDMDDHLLNLIKSKTHLVVGNKVDLHQPSVSIPADIFVSAKMNINLDQLEKKILEKFSLEEIETRDLTYLSNQRHLDLLFKTQSHLEKALLNASQNEVVDVIQLDLRHAWEALSEISGSQYHESLVEDMFRRFCLGK